MAVAKFASPYVIILQNIFMNFVLFNTASGVECVVGAVKCFPDSAVVQILSVLTLRQKTLFICQDNNKW